MGYTKLFNEILLSTIWQEPDHVRLVWISMLAMKDECHQIMASELGVAKMANVSLEKTQEAIKILESPDPHSRSTDFEGRRIKKIDGGWFVLNGEKYRRKMSLEDRREYQKNWVRNKRESLKNIESVDSVSTNVNRVEKVDDVYTTEHNITEHNISKNKQSSIKFDLTLGAFQISEDKLKSWKNTYVGVDIETEMKKAAAWAIEKKARKRNWGQFLINWFNRCEPARKPKTGPFKYLDLKGNEI